MTKLSTAKVKHQNLVLTRGESPVIDLKQNYGHRYRIGRDECDDQLIPHKWGHFYSHSATELACFVEGNKKFNRIMQQFPDIRIMQEGDDEIIFVFDPDLLPKLAKVLKASKKRQTSETERERLATIGIDHRFEAS